MGVLTSQFGTSTLIDAPIMVAVSPLESPAMCTSGSRIGGVAESGLWLINVRVLGRSLSAPGPNLSDTGRDSFHCDRVVSGSLSEFSATALNGFSGLQRIGESHATAE